MMINNKSKAKKFILVLSIMISCLFLSVVGFISFVYHKYDLDIGKLTSLNNGIKVYSASGNDSTLYNTNRSIVDIDELPEHVKNAFISIEDKNFYKHNGYDLKRIAKALFVNATTKSKSQGASTISQQLVKNALLSNEKTYSRKIQEVVLAIKMEKQFSKDDILEMYLNTIYFGSNAYGIENASKIYFNKSAKDLSLNEACCLAGLIKSPAYYSPKTHYENSIERKNLVAKRMLATKNIDKIEYESVLNSQIILNNDEKLDNSYEKEAIFEACNLLNIKERDLINKKYQIITFKQDEIQNEVAVINNEIIENAEQSTNSSLDSLSVVANNEGHVLAYYANSNYNLHNLTRQPASTLKPFAVYLPCFEHNILSPASKILDEPINYSGFTPQNADKTFHGYVSTRFALSHSLNIPAVKALDYLGVKKAKESLSNAGINISNSDLNLSLALGAVKNGVKLLDLLSAYTVLTNQGNLAPLCFVDKILDEHGNIIYSHEKYLSNVFDAGSCFMVNDILKDCAKSGTAKRLASLEIPIASKTGTASNSQGNTDLYNIAYTTEHTILTWIADIDQNSLPSTLLSSSQPTDINKNICSYLYRHHKPYDFNQPENVVKLPYDLIEYESKHIILQPNHDIERYTDYDYFKIDNIPKYAGDNILDLNLKVGVTKMGAIISFDAKKCCKYNILKQTNKGKSVITTIKDQTGLININDKDIFIYDYIEYSIEDEQGNLISKSVKIKPQDYLINLLNNEIISSKKKWLV